MLVSEGWEEAQSAWKEAASGQHRKCGSNGPMDGSSQHEGRQEAGDREQESPGFAMACLYFGLTFWALRGKPRVEVDVDLCPAHLHMLTAFRTFSTSNLSMRRPPWGECAALCYAALPTNQLRLHSSHPAQHTCSHKINHKTCLTHPALRSPVHGALRATACRTQGQ